MPSFFDFLEFSKYSDFTIKSGPFTFKVHKLVVSCGSRFFDKLCSNGFKESSEAVVTLYDDDPIILARMLLYLYTSDYETDEKNPDLLRRIMIQATYTNVDAEHCREVPKVILAAQMYGIAEKYDVTGLKDLSVARFLAKIEQTPMQDLLAMVDIIYDSTPETDNLLRRWVVWRIQVSKKSVEESNRLTTLVYQQHDFAQDLITKYAARNYVWCPDCKSFVDLEQCRCGWSGVCGYQLCTRAGPERDLTGLVCTLCNAAGRLQYDRA